MIGGIGFLNGRAVTVIQIAKNKQIEFVIEILKTLSKIVSLFQFITNYNLNLQGVYRGIY